MANTSKRQPPPIGTSAVKYRLRHDRRGYFVNNLHSLAATGPIVVVEIGPERKKYYIHRALLVHHSEYFRKALHGSWQEAEKGVVALDDVELTVCKLKYM